MEIDGIKELITLLKDSDISELMVEQDGTKIRIRRQAQFQAVEMQPQVQPVHNPAIKETEEDVHRLVTVTSPIVGTFYRAPSPEASSFVEIGAQVKKGQVLCIVEAMKLMNEIESEVDGIVVRALAENGHPVEYGEPLFLIEPAA